MFQYLQSKILVGWGFWTYCYMWRQTYFKVSSKNPGIAFSYSVLNLSKQQITWWEWSKSLTDELKAITWFLINDCKWSEDLEHIGKPIKFEQGY